MFILDGVFGHAKNDIASSINVDGNIVSPVTSAECTNKDGSQSNADSSTTCFDWSSANTKTFFEKLAANMITKYHIDGWRLDQAYQVPNAEWKKISSAVKYAATSGRPGAGYMVAEVWSGKEDINRSVFGDAAVESAFNFPLRYKLVQVLAGQEDASSDEATGREASFIANPWGYGSMATYTCRICLLITTILFDLEICCSDMIFLILSLQNLFLKIT